MQRRMLMGSAAILAVLAAAGWASGPAEPADSMARLEDAAQSLKAIMPDQELEAGSLAAFNGQQALMGAGLSKEGTPVRAQDWRKWEPSGLGDYPGGDIFRPVVPPPGGDHERRWARKGRAVGGVVGGLASYIGGYLAVLATLASAATPTIPSAIAWGATFVFAYLGMRTALPALVRGWGWVGEKTGGFLGKLKDRFSK